VTRHSEFELQDKIHSPAHQRTKICFIGRGVITIFFLVLTPGGVGEPSVSVRSVVIMIRSEFEFVGLGDRSVVIG